MKTVCCFGGFLCQLLIIGQVIVLYIGEGGGHLLDVEHLRSLLIARPLTGSQLRLNIHRQTDFPFRVPGAFFFALNGGQNILQVVAVPPQRGGTQTGEAFLSLPGQPEADTAAPNRLDLTPGPLHQIEKFVQISGAFCQCGINGKVQSVLIGKRLFPVFLPLPIVPILALASGLRVLHDGQPVFKAQPVRNPPKGEAGAQKFRNFRVQSRVLEL